MQQRGQVQDELAIIIHHAQEGTKLGHVAWSWGLENGSYFTRRGMDTLGIDMMTQVVHG